MRNICANSKCKAALVHRELVGMARGSRIIEVREGKWFCESCRHVMGRTFEFTLVLVSVLAAIGTALVKWWGGL